LSYLDLPRIHFGGLFFTGPSTINNITTNYEASTKLEDPNHQYIPGVAGWNALGVAQWWMEECSILSGVGPDGTLVTAGDPVIGAAVETPSPATPKQDPSGADIGIAKMVDLDPDQQGRSAVYGIYLFVTLANGAGFSGTLSVPELRQLNPRFAVNLPTSWAAVGVWMGVIENVVWSGDVSGSPLLTGLKAASGNGISVRFIVDLHQNNPANLLTAGDLFCYGRIQGSFGPALPDELAQMLPGRQLVQPPAAATAAPAAAASRRQVPARAAVAARVVALSAAPAPPVWNPAFALVRKTSSGSLLHVDLGASLLLELQKTNPPQANGRYLVSTGFQLGVMNPDTKAFQPFKHGAISFADQYVNHPSQNKNCVLVRNAGIVTFALTAAEAALVKSNPLALAYQGKEVLLEPPTGIWADVSVSSLRLEIGGSSTSAQFQVMVLNFGAPSASSGPPVSAAVQVLAWESPYDPNNNPVPTASTDLTVSISPPNAAGVASVTVGLKTQGNSLPPPRQPLNSVIYFVLLSDAQGNPIGDGAGGNATVSALVWNPFTPPAQTTWADISAVFGAYARLYPGMKSRLDISDQATVAGFIGDLLEHMAAPIEDPAYMPVTRDLQPGKVNMILDWLKQQSSPT
jgi:hypothetical protein